MLPPPINPPDVVNMFRVLDHHQHCFYCGIPTREQWERSKEHVVPRSKGGKTLGNVVNACRPCNRAKGSLDLEQFRALRYHNRHVEFFGEVIFRKWLNRRSRSQGWDQVKAATPAVDLSRPAAD